MLTFWHLALPWLVLALQAIGAAVAFCIFMVVVCTAVALYTRLVVLIMGWY